MREHKTGNLRFFSYRSFEPFRYLTNVVTTRVGGTSKPPYEGLNLGLHVGDDADDVLENRALASQALGIEPEALTFPEQIHGNVVAAVGGKERGCGAVTADNAVKGADALITRSPGVPLTVLVADCVAISFYDPRRAAIGLAHAGWKGTLGRIAERTVEAMQTEYDSSPGDLHAGIGPSIGKGHYEVGREVLEAFGKEFGRSEAARFIREDMHGTCYLDLWGLNASQLQAAGIDADHIEVTESCTACRPDLFYSHRHEQGTTGRFAGLIMLHAPGSRLY
ncbi:MAG: peptidoglycan editing factor PgeF [Candidatus Krumholzibacteriia bacterium]